MSEQRYNINPNQKYEYWFSEDGGKTFRTVGIVDGNTVYEIMGQPITKARFVREFKRL